MLGEDLAGDEQAVGLEAALGDDAAILAEQIGRDAGEADRDRRRGLVADQEVDRHAVGMAADRAVLDHAADPHRAVERQAFAGDVAGRVEEGRLVAHRRHGEQHRADHRGEGEQEQDEALVLGLHGRSPSASASASARRIAAQLQPVSAERAERW